jgi:hypothetical protein
MKKLQAAIHSSVTGAIRLVLPQNGLKPRVSEGLMRSRSLWDSAAASGSRWLFRLARSSQQKGSR